MKTSTDEFESLHIDTVPQEYIEGVIHEINDLGCSFGSENWRESHPDSPHLDTESIYLRMPEEISVNSVFNELLATTTVWGRCSPITMRVVMDAMHLLNLVELGRVMLVKLKPGGKITPHPDEGAYCAYYNRYHIPIVTNDDVLFTVGEKTVNMGAGELWEINNKKVHSVVNNGDTDRIHLIFDARPL